MTAPIPATIPASLATACAAHDRHRLDVLDALLDEAAPSAVRELLGAALDLCASLRADLASERAHLAACQARIAGLEQAANERSRTGQMPESERAEWISAAVAVADALGGSLGPVAGASGTIDPREWVHFAAGLADRAKKLAARAAELEARPVLTVERLTEAWCCAGAEIGTPNRSYVADLAGRAMRHLGPVTLPPAQDRAEELTQAIHGTPREEVNPAMWRGMVERTRSALASLGAPPTSPPAARPVFAGVSASDLLAAYGDGYNHPSKWITIDDAKDCNGNRLAGLRAILARLDATLIAPVDPIALALDFAEGAGVSPGTIQRSRAEAAMRATLTARGIPVTPEVGK